MSEAEFQDHGLVDELAAAAILGVARGTLQVWRCTRRYDLRFVKVGRLVRYRKSDLQAFLDQRTVGSDTPLSTKATAVG